MPSLEAWLDAPLPRWARVFGLGLETPRLADALAIASAVVALRGAGFDLAPFAAEGPGQLFALVARIALLFLALRAGSIRTAAGVGIVFVASLAARAFVLPDVLVSLVAIRFAPRARIDAPAAPSWTIAVICALGAVAFVPRPVVAAPAPPSDPAPATAYWRGRRNLRRAHAAAVEWARHEAPPREGYLALAEIDWEMGDRERAHKVLQKVIDRSDSDAARTRAQELARAWGPREPDAR